ncbi:MAG: hypothetical protein PHC75_08645, partial [Burkholderiales bacterium]|nr:hypothetical protein [Burkholderiales bacterium]
VKQATKTEFDNHTNNTGIHVTPTEKTLWNTVEDKADKTSVLTPVPENAVFTDTVTTINGKTGAILKDDITALGIPAQDTVYVHPATHPATMIVEDETHRFVTDDEITTWTNSNHTHNNLSLLQTITQTLVDGWNSAVTHITDTIKHITSSERTLWNTVSNKVDKVVGKGLSTEDYTSAEKTKLGGIADNANNYVHPSTHDASMITGLADVATSGNYNDLLNKPSITTTPTASFTIPATIGWYRIAQSPNDSDLSSCFMDLRWQGNGHKGHCVTSIKTQGINQPVLTQLLCNSSNGSPYIYYVRIVRPSIATGNKTYLEVYLAYAYEITIDIFLNNNVGWELFSSIQAGSTPSGYGSYQLSYSNYAPIQTSSTSTCSGLNATYLQGYTLGSIQKKYTTSPSLPTPSSSYRNEFYWIVTTGIDDILYRCIQKADNSYVWQEIASTEYVDNAVSSSGSSDGALIFDKIANQIGVKVIESVSGLNYISQAKQASSGLLLADKTDSKSGENYITIIRVYNTDGITVKQTFTITESKVGDNYETTVT